MRVLVIESKSIPFHKAIYMLYLWEKQKNVYQEIKRMNTLSSYIVYAIIIIATIIAIAVIIGVIWVFKSPFNYPYFIYYFDVSSKRNPQIVDLIDGFLNSGNFYAIQKHNEYISLWKQKCQEQIEKSKIKNYREKQFRACLDDNHAFRFYLTRQQTRYKQKNYVKTAYKVTQTVNQFFCDYSYLQNRNKQLEHIHYECTLRDYYSKNQRKLMTKELRRKIMIRDNYTCQSCGKYMPDEVGLHIDHIIPVSKGGKTVPSNLQVLCSKCNGNKSNKRPSS